MIFAVKPDVRCATYQFKRSGKKNVTHKPTNKEKHLKQLKARGVFSLSSPLSLLRNDWFHIVLFFCRRGREGQRALATKSFNLVADATGRKFATIDYDEASKNFQVVSMTSPVTKKKLGCAKLQANTMATRL